MSKAQEIINIVESSMSRIWQHIQNGDSFGVISALDKDLSKGENLRRHSQLKKDIRTKYGFVEQTSGYTYHNKETGKEEYANEMSFFIPKISYNDIISLGNKYNQETIIFKDDGRFDLIDPKKGSVEMSFSKDTKSVTFDKDIVKYAWSKFLKSNSKSSKVYAFKVKETIIPSKLDSFLALKEKIGLAQTKHILIMDVQHG